MKVSDKEATPMRKVLERLGQKSSVVQTTLARLRERGVKASVSLIYKTINGEVQRHDVAETFLEVAEEEFTRRAQLQERARQLADA
ncbi:hypothetical protein KBK19_16780 [Microvirga sp. STR05]|uniref:KfrA N-terminal DNA-binding domain-containing protein n=1 Tax=Hymenobacter duratus TaxID=2771356 RepID=A0ABR8JMU4_9BACT|nr:hypothetical protein [Hymenobacter duratus]MBD2716702.1 hypothetical protein [Hymenobacter duratus]MBR7951617.1 hypothetical protein [Microvirga sp. STR05]